MARMRMLPTHTVRLALVAVTLGLFMLLMSGLVLSAAVSAAAARPVVTGVSPRSGPVAGGNVVTVTGTGFSGATSVRFGTVSTTHFKVVSATKITVKVPAQAAGTHDVEVTTPGGRSQANSQDRYTYK